MDATRRHLILSGLGLGAAAALGPAALARPRGPAGAAREELFRISLAEWSLHRTIGAGELTNLDFARVAKQEFGLDAIEYVSLFFPRGATDFDSLRELRARAEDQGVRSLLIMIDGEGQLADADDAQRRTAIENHFKWIAAAKFLGCHSIRVNAGGGGTPEEQMERAADSLHRLAGMGEQYGIDVIVENHGGLSSNGAWLAETIRRADHPRCGTLPDFGNFDLGGGKWYDRYQGIAEMMPFARAVSAKSHEFDAEGNETRTDYSRMLKIVVDAGYHGYVGIEFEGDGIPEREGIAKTKALLERVRARLSAPAGGGRG
ncbi:MAG: sugar phosphate isomerase/epimerase family protein [Planctomycetota bacterium]